LSNELNRVLVRIDNYAHEIQQAITTARNIVHTIERELNEIRVNLDEPLGHNEAGPPPRQ
jgi:predicted  nucleic acid-binding Zn-ribbon protein